MATMQSMEAHTWEPSTEETEAGRLMLPTTDMGLPCNWGLNPRERHLWKWIWGDLALMYFHVASRPSSFPKSDQGKGWWKQETVTCWQSSSPVGYLVISAAGMQSFIHHLYVIDCSVCHPQTMKQISEETCHRVHISFYVSFQHWRLRLNKMGQ